MTLLENSVQTLTVEDALNAARLRVQVTPVELTEARQRRDDLRDCLAREFGGRTYINGSIAHGDALNPLSDVDLGVVVPDPEHEYGPGRRGPRALQGRAADAIRRDLKAKYPSLRVENNENRRRSVLVRFGDPVTAGQADFTADVIVAIDNWAGAGLYIPNYLEWDRSHPEEHTRLVKNANVATESTFARGTRLMKHWNRMHDKPICSWNIKALALDCITASVTMTGYINTWLEHAIEQLSLHETPDPAGVAGPIKINQDFTMAEVITAFSEAHDIFNRALMLEDEGYLILAINELAKFFRDEDMMPFPDQGDVRAAEAERFRSKTFSAPASAAVTASTTALGSRINTRSWSC